MAHSIRSIGRMVPAAVVAAAMVALPTAVMAEEVAAAPGGTGVAELWWHDSVEAVTIRTPRLPLGEEVPEDGLVGFESVTADRYPNYLRLYAMVPEGVSAMANLARSVLYDGRVDAELKMAMGLEVASIHGSAYTAAHMARLLAATERGRALKQAVTSDNVDELRSADRIGLAHARALTREVNGLDDDSFGELRRSFNEPQIVELTIVVCFFDYFCRVVEAVNLPLESWALEPATTLTRHGSYAAPEARVGLLTDEEVEIIAARLHGDRPTSSLGVKVPNSVRAMARASDQRKAWGDLSRAIRAETAIGETMQHYVSNEVSYRNDCYYCITHQVEKLKNVGIPISHIARVVNSDDALNEREREAVLFARQVTDDPTAISDAKFASLRKTFTDRGAFEIIQVAARFNFMNRFTSGLQLPSEPTPIETYEAVERERRR